MRNSECGVCSASCGCARGAAAFRSAHSAHSAFRLPPSAVPSARGVTLIELLITMTIIAIISAAILGTAAAAMENARRNRTRSTISKIHGLVMERWDSYVNRRVDVSPLITRAINNWANEPGISVPLRRQRTSERGAMLAEARLLALRELIKLEMPDRWTDVANGPLPATELQPRPVFLAGTPGLSRMYFRRLLMAQENAGEDGPLRFQSAECLYMLVMYGTGDGEARTMFTTQDIGDVDGDGAPEFLDGWGNPIRFIRWPAGFVAQSPLMTGDGEKDHDPFDVFRRDSPTAEIPDMSEYSALPAYFVSAVQQLRNRNLAAAADASEHWPYLSAFRLVPLIFSHGADEEGSLYSVAELADVAASGSDLLNMDPYTADGAGVQSGLPDPESKGWRDNIHNHVNEY